MGFWNQCCATLALFGRKFSTCSVVVFCTKNPPFCYSKSLRYSTILRWLQCVLWYQPRAMTCFEIVRCANPSWYRLTARRLQHPGASTPALVLIRLQWLPMCTLSKFTEAWVLWQQCTIAQPSGRAIAYILHHPACPCVFLKSKSCAATYTPILLTCSFELQFWL